MESHPQYQWSITEDNLLLMPEFQDWHGELHVGNFIWVTFRDNYSVKLRISEIQMNPLMVDPELTISFTTMTQYRSKRNDYTDLLSRANASTKNQITAAIRQISNKDNTVNIDTALILKILNSQSFANYSRSITDNASIIATDTVNSAPIKVNHIVGS